MSEPAPADGGSAGQVPPRLSIHGQYIKRLSVTTPGGVRRGSPKVGLRLDVAVNPLAAQSAEVVLAVELDAHREETRLCRIALVYAGEFHLENVPEDLTDIVLNVECPRHLFPFVQRLLGYLTGDAGIVPVNLAPIDFAKLYERRLRPPA
ncbi:MAG: protein-export chaperone SecB [Alphaproteobacteria bacterium]|nr:protein-export chaperone SecB [Alphaproteobacteria bacterium]